MYKDIINKQKQHEKTSKEAQIKLKKCVSDAKKIISDAKLTTYCH